MSEVRLTAEEWESSKQARKKLEELETRRTKAVATAIKGRHAYYDKLRAALLDGLTPEVRALVTPQAETVEDLDDAEVIETSDESEPA